MAGAGYKLFNTGDVLTAAQVNTYLQEQAVMRFANATARTTALSGVLAEGMMSYLDDTNSVEVYNGSAWVSVGSTGDITGVTAGTGISGGGTSGDVTITNSMATAIDAKGDLIAGTGADTFARLAVGTNGHRLIAASGETTGLKWEGFVGCQATKTTGQSIATGTQVALTFDTETNGFDTNSFHDNSTNNTRFTIPSGHGGYYEMTGITRVGFGAYGYDVRLLKNGGTIATACAVVPSGYDGPGIITHVANLAAGDYIEFAVQQGSGSNKTFLGNDSYTAATIFRIIKLGV